MPIELVCDHDDWQNILPHKPLEDVLETMEQLSNTCFSTVFAFDDACTGDVALMLTSDAHMRSLNRDFRDRDKPTNVLSFPGPGDDGHLGDIALGYETCVFEAQEKNIPANHHIAHLIVHGLLHLIDYDHSNKEDARKMETLEVKILARLNIDNPYRGELVG